MLPQGVWQPAWAAAPRRVGLGINRIGYAVLREALDGSTVDLAEMRMCMSSEHFGQEMPFARRRVLFSV